MTSRLKRIILAAAFANMGFAQTADQQARARRLEESILAPCCYRQPLSVHQSEIAVKMRLEIVKWVTAGKSDREILDTYVGLYGPGVLVDPRTKPRKWMQYVPWLVLLIGIAGVIGLLRRWSVVSSSDAGTAAAPPKPPDRSDPDYD
jgi:cytochrome c-type biogenesis protein CcmH/NrfF